MAAMNAAPTVLLCGAGQLGSRYLQGLAHCRIPLAIFVLDLGQASLDRARQRWEEVAAPGSPHRVSFHAAPDALPARFDLAVSATTADARPRSVAEIAGRAAVRYWVLEKVLAQGDAALEALALQVADSAGTWVNTPRRVMPWHREIRSRLAPGRPLALDVAGGRWGLACNAVHFLDLLAWWTGETLEEVSTAGLGPQWFESKRPGFMEVYGTLAARYSGGSRALLRAADADVPLLMTVEAPGASWRIDEAAGLARRSDGAEVRGRIVHQSELTAGLAQSILEGGDCELPRLEDSAKTHRALLRGLLDHWRRAGHPAAAAVPIT